MSFPKITPLQGERLFNTFFEAHEEKYTLGHMSMSKITKIVTLCSS